MHSIPPTSITLLRAPNNLHELVLLSGLRPLALVRTNKDRILSNYHGAPVSEPCGGNNKFTIHLSLLLPADHHLVYPLSGV